MTQSSQAKELEQQAKAKDKAAKEKEEQQLEATRTKYLERFSSLLTVHEWRDLYTRYAEEIGAAMDKLRYYGVLVVKSSSSDSGRKEFLEFVKLLNEDSVVKLSSKAYNRSVTISVRDLLMAELKKKLRPALVKRWQESGEVDMSQDMFTHNMRNHCENLIEEIAWDAAEHKKGEDYPESLDVLSLFHVYRILAFIDSSRDSVKQSVAKAAATAKANAQA